jgi:hypothetical protein
MGVRENRVDLKKGEEEIKRYVNRPASVVSPIKRDAGYAVYLNKTWVRNEKYLYRNNK